MPDYNDYKLEKSSRKLEAIEWSITYAFNATDEKSPRVLLIGDSICNGYAENVRAKLGGKMNVSFWASSKCVTDLKYTRELDFILDVNRADIILFNNGLHSSTEHMDEWEEAYRKVLRFIRAKQPKAKLAVITSTPLQHAENTKKVLVLNQYTVRIAKEEGVPVMDLFAVMDPLDREANWRDEYHYQPEAIQKQADALSAFILKEMNMLEAEDSLKQESSATGPDGAIK